MTRRVELAVRIGACITVVAGWGATAAAVAPQTAAPTFGSAVPVLAALDSVTALRPDSLARHIAGRNPFRVSRSAALVAFRVGGDQPPPVPATPPPPPRPSLALAGVIMGNESAALIDGLPGVDGTRVLRVGERVGGYELRSVTSESAVVAGPDTVWTLRVRSRFP